MYFQAVYILGNFWKFWSLLSGFVKANLAFGLIYEARTQVGLDETRTATQKMVFFYI